MTWRPQAPLASPVVVAVALLAGLIVLVIAVSCGGDSSNGSGPTEVPEPTKRPTGLPTDEEGTPRSPEEHIVAFADQLDAVGVNIGSIPGDVQRQILIDCGLLVNYADQETVRQLCNATAQAMDRHDPGLLDLVVDELRKLEPN